MNILRAFISLSALFTTSLSVSHADDWVVSNQNIQKNLTKAEHLKLHQKITWQRLLYIENKKQSEVKSSDYFLHAGGAAQPALELQENIKALYEVAPDNQSFRCRFPARSEWLMQQLDIKVTDLPKVSCSEFEQWFSEVNPYKVTLIYATDFMGNPSSMFGHTFFRLDPKNKEQLNLVSYAVNYAATVNDQDNWSYAIKGLIGQYPGEYSLMPYYQKVKEYSDLESRDLWEYQLNLNEQETQFLVKHLWEMRDVSFPYYFTNDNCSYRLLGLIDLVKPEQNLKNNFQVSAVPIETIRAIDEKNLIQSSYYRPALETQLLSQAQQHGSKLAKKAHSITQIEPELIEQQIQPYSNEDQAKILEMAYDDLYLQLIARTMDDTVVKIKARKILGLRSQLNEQRQRQVVQTPKIDPLKGHHPKNIAIDVGQVQNQNFIRLATRQAYHHLLDPQGGFRTGTQFSFMDLAIQRREHQLKLESLKLFDIYSLNPMTSFKTPISWGVSVGWEQAGLNRNGAFSSTEQHGVLDVSSQVGYSVANNHRTHVCYAQLQNHIQAGKALDKGWRVGLGPTLGCQNIWTDSINSLVQVELPYWQDSHQWNLSLSTQLQYAFNQQNALRLKWKYIDQNNADYQQYSVGYVHYY